MKYRADIEEIRRLLTRYYSGESTVEEEEAILDFFIGQPTTEIPTDLKADAELFKALPTLCAEVPADLLAEIDTAVESEKKKKRSIRLWTWVSCSAAAVIIIFVIFFVLWHRTPEKEISDAHGLTAQTIEKDETTPKSNNGFTLVSDSKEASRLLIDVKSKISKTFTKVSEVQKKLPNLNAIINNMRDKI